MRSRNEIQKETDDMYLEHKLTIELLLDIREFVAGLGTQEKRQQIE